MDSISVDTVYGRALFEAAGDLGKTDEVGKELKELTAVLKDNPEFFGMLKSPAVPNDEKKKVIGIIFEGNLSEILLNFIYVLADKRRMVRYLGIAKAYEKCLEEKQGITTGTIFSAVEISDKKLKKFEKETGALLKKNVELKSEIDRSLIGGVKIYIDGKLIDASIRRRLDDLKESLL